MEQKYIYALRTTGDECGISWGKATRPRVGNLEPNLRENNTQMFLWLTSVDYHLSAFTSGFLGLMDHIDNVTFSTFFFIQTKNKPHNLIYCAEFSKYIRFPKNLLEILDHKIVIQQMFAPWTNINL